LRKTVKINNPLYKFYMIKIETFTFNPFQENTYLLIGENNQAIIIDPGCSNSLEQNEIIQFLNDNELTLSDCWLTHAHIDHVMGCSFIFNKFGLKPKLNKHDLFLYQATPQVAKMYGLPFEQGPEPIIDFESGASFNIFENEPVKILFIPGHAPGHVGFYLKNQAQILAGDVLFRQSIGRTDLPGGDYNTLENSIREKLYTLPDNVEVFPGHGPTTTIGFEKKNNGFFTV
jgi:hydroxyacylglutathione hydrolase